MHQPHTPVHFPLTTRPARRRTVRPPRRPLTAALLALVVLLTACGAADPGPDDAPGGAGGAGAPDRPEAVVSLSPTATETLFALGAGDQVVAVDDQSDYPQEAPRTELSGYTPNVEAVLGYSPDLVLTASDDKDLAAGLERAGVEVLVLEAATDLEDAYGQIEQIGEATGHVDEAEELVAGMRDDIEAAVADAPDGTGLTYFHELDPSLYSATGDTFIGQVYGLFGLESVADAAADGDDYPQLSAEYVVEADPDLVFLADAHCCGVTVEKVAARAGWRDLAAVRNDRVHVLEDDIPSRWGPRVVDFVEAVAEALRQTSDE